MRSVMPSRQVAKAETTKKHFASLRLGERKIIFGKFIE